LHRFFWQEKVQLENFWDVRHDKVGDDNDIDWVVYSALQKGIRPDQSAHKVLQLTAGAVGQYYTDDDIAVLSPSEEILDYCNHIDSWNNSSYVLRIDYGGRRVILGGDAEKPAWDYMEAHLDHDELRCDVLKAAHHGRDSGYSESAVKLMDPDVVICSVGKKPDTDASDEYMNHGARVLSTRYNGTIKMVMWADGEIWFYNHKGERIEEVPPL
jgi:beta-lactamase superfamily II metal-dependent hydrolase